MGAWDVSSFGNDTACDWAWELKESSDLSVVEETIDRVFDTAEDGYIEAPTGEEAIAACETIARLKGRFGIRNSYTKDVDKWIAAHPLQPSPEMVEKANNALDLIMSDNSELRQLYEESDSFAEWQASVSDLRQRMN
ncbi:MAG TPA: DUF4259 domain-containing protein [Lacipirellulaceae bacterium]|nr:DUF4259 domain-containing protein [Lacipirellulaceae bacterium]